MGTCASTGARRGGAVAHQRSRHTVNSRWVHQGGASTSCVCIKWVRQHNVCIMCAHHACASTRRGANHVCASTRRLRIKGVHQRAVGASRGCINAPLAHQEGTSRGCINGAHQEGASCGCIMCVRQGGCESASCCCADCASACSGMALPAWSMKPLQPPSLPFDSWVRAGGCGPFYHALHYHVTAFSMGGFGTPRSAH
jgi:hypothetical protein